MIEVFKMLLWLVTSCTSSICARGCDDDYLGNGIDTYEHLDVSGAHECTPHALGRQSWRPGGANKILIAMAINS